MQRRKLLGIVTLVALLSMVLTSVAVADVSIPTFVDGPGDNQPDQVSHRLIVELDSPALADAYQSGIQAAGVNGKLDVSSSAAQAYITQLQAEQAAFVVDMQSALEGAEISTFVNEMGVAEELTYQIVFNGMAIDPGAMGREEAKATLSRMDGVRTVHYDQAYETQLYTSTSLISAPAVWNSDAVGGVGNAGAGIKVASMDGGIHKDAPMFDGTGYSYPAGFGPNGLGLTENNNGKIIASRTYFRSWDPPAPGDENPWPGQNGTSHGVHTSSTAAGNCVDNVTYLGATVGTMCGVAPEAYVMSYRVFYASVNGNESFYTAEGVAALEDIVADGPDVLNNSWGEGPISEGGIFDPIDSALINAANAGIFVSMSAGNAGPGVGTNDHPSSEYISVAASTTSGTYAAGVVGVSAPAPVPDELKNFDFSTASDFGSPLPVGEVVNYEYLPSAAVDEANVTGCGPFPENAFAGKAALVSRGGCFFADKFYYAEQAGAEFVVLYNNAGDGLISMGCGGEFCDEITVSGIFIGQTNGEAMLDWYEANGGASELEFNSIAFQAGNTPDYIISFSSRGPAPSNVLKPDIAAPGVNIMAQGYTPNTTGEARHLGYGQASGTSMAAPHVAGAGALLKQVHPDWSTDNIKSAMMSTSKYMNIYNYDGSNAQPLDMGAGRLDVAAATDPGVFLNPPSLSYGLVMSGTQKTIDVQVTSIASAAETYSLSTVYTGESFTQTVALPGFSVSPASITLNPGETKTVQVTFDGVGMGIGENQGYIVMSGDNGHDAHMPAWARVTYAEPLADVLIIDNDFSDGLGLPNYLWYYTDTLDQLGLTYNIVNVDNSIGYATTIPEPAVLLAHKAIIWYTGDNYEPDGTYSVSTGLTLLDQDRLIDYLNGGGTLIAMGQDLASALGTNEFDAEVGNRNFLYVYRLGANYIQDSVSDGYTPDQFIAPSAEAPVAFANLIVDLTQARKYAGVGALLGENEVPQVDTGTTGAFLFEYDLDQNLLEISVAVAPTTTTPIEVTGAHIHFGAADSNGPVVRSLDFDGELPTVVTDTLTLSGAITDLSDTELGQFGSGQFYVNVHTTVNPGGEIRGQMLPFPLDNQVYVDEIDNVFHDDSGEPEGEGTSESNLASTALLKYQGPYNIFDGTVAMGHRDQPSLERPGTDYSGRSVYTTFGLEGMNSSINATLGYTPTTRAELISAFLTWSWAESSEVTIENATPANGSDLMTFTASLNEEVNAADLASASAAVSYRWDFGDGSAYVASASNTAGHTYLCADNGDNVHTVRAEIVDTMGVVSLGSLQVDISDYCLIPTGIEDVGEPEDTNQNIFLPLVGN